MVYGLLSYLIMLLFVVALLNVIGMCMVSVLYLILLGVYLRCVFRIYRNFIVPCRCYLCFVVYINYLIIRHAQFCNVCNL